MTTSPVKGRGESRRPVRSFASHTPKWQRFQNKMVRSQDGNSSGSKPKNSSLSSVKYSDKEIVSYQRQYSHVYSYRLAALKEGCKKALEKLPPSRSSCKSVNRILELREDQLSNVVGTIIVESMNGNSDDNYYNDNPGEDRKLHPDAVCRSHDQLFLEDESGRVALRFVVGHESNDGGGEGDDASPGTTTFAYEYCTGAVVGVRGSVDAMGVMHVRRIVDPVLAPPATPCGGDDDYDESTSSPHLLLVSSLLCGDPTVGSLPRELLVSYLQGHFGETASRVARIVVAGSGPGSVDPAMGLREFDLWGLEVTRTAGIPLDILPSATDPTTRNWPQRPLHSSLLPHTLRVAGNHNNNSGGGCGTQNIPMARMTPNPYEASIGNQVVLGTDGLNVRDLKKYVLKPPPSDTPQATTSDKEIDSDQPPSPQLLTELEALEQTLRWAHICPTGPNSPDIGMVPSDDPMVMSRGAPNVYFCGNCEEGFATKLLQHGSSSNNNDDASKTRLVCIPKFSETGEVVLVNLKTLEVEVLRFAAGCDGGTDPSDGGGDGSVDVA
mmetsp:Transcript_16048/g.33204  ORF Transcript_16048/g.33204 Transcript_16048/m.33204 type:complete len:552 (+) Transcript_16048:182-1837(+)|eukprot:CAMPEP_0201144694 /NCGR_PEP_ID=MMETSP0851-20130426/6429_1 /ASSEMBLY_ACC=CAM_ASM_000631 /TAXON_ID=183588 /ORGANISM="Pseudo-nitzschia fraudulenta, Strain WWA7" /LENGTH=551 /DNA_ID=CAMNT_0047419553 /DNA_START=178 /DNA_END=1833 /DNA_ORIENTATION=-